MRRRIQLIAWLGIPLTAMLPARAAAQSLPETVEAIHHAGVTTRILFITAHPDDEWPSLISYLSHECGAEVALLTITRGQGGQNAIGPEQGDEMGMLRTHELLAADKIYGVEQFFTRAPDFGYSKSAEETLKFWDRIALDDMVRVIRTFRPQIVINGWGGVHGGHGQHQASGILTPQAVVQAGDENAFAAQFAEGLHPWRTPLLLEFARRLPPRSASTVRGGEESALQIPTEKISSLWGKSYIELGIEGRSQHRSQGTPAASGATFFRQPIYLQIAPESITKNGLDFVDLNEPLSSLARRFPTVQSTLARVLSRADQQIEAAQKSALALDWPATAKNLAAADIAIAGVRQEVSERSGMESANAAWELARVSEKIERALTDVMAEHVEARADRHEVVAGENFSIHTIRFEGPRVGSIKIQSPGLQMPAGWQIIKQEPDASGERFTIAIPANAKRSMLPLDAILPWPPPLVQAIFQASVEGYDFALKIPVVAVRATSTEVLTYPLELVPAVSLTVEPQQIMLPKESVGEQIDLLARVRYHGTAPADVSPGLDVPSGWAVAPIGPLHFTGSGDQIVRFALIPPAHPVEGAYSLKPFARRGMEIFSDSVEPLPSLPTRLWREPATATVHVLDLAVPPRLRVGYIAAEMDPIPDLLRQLGITVEPLDEVQLAFSDLHRFDAIVVGVRAYELRADLTRANPRLLDYVANGGTLVVQFEHTDVWNNLHPAPFPASIAPQGARTTDENSPVRFVAPDSSLLNFPNKITMKDFDGWIQERGLYYWDKWDSRYQAVLALRDPGEEEALGSLVAARDGKGTYIYTGLAFFRQLPAGVPGAFRLFVNLLSQSKAK